MGVFEMVVVLVLIGTAGKVARAFAPRRLPAETEARVRALEAALQASEARLAETEERVADLGEKLVFMEDLLASPERRTPLPPGSR
jgi:hypothetical protein